MTRAVITTTTLSPPFTAAVLMDSIATAITNAGIGTLIDPFTDGANAIHRVFQIAFNSNATKGNCFWDIYTNNYDSSYPNQKMVLSKIYDAFNTTSHTGTNGSTAIAFSPTIPNSWLNHGSATPILVTTINHPEFKGIYIIQGANIYYHSVLRPISIPSWWSENSFLYAFLNAAGNLLSFAPLATTGNPLTVNTTIPIMSSTALGTANSITSKRDIFAGLVLIHPANQGIIARTSNDLVLIAASGMNFLDTLVITPGAEEYTLITAGGTPGVAIRTV